MEKSEERGVGKPADEIRARLGLASGGPRAHVSHPDLQGGFAPVDPQQFVTMANATQTIARRGTETRKKTFVVSSRYDAAEYAELEEAASRAGLTRASYQRVQSLAVPKTRSTRRAPIERELLAKTLWHLGKIGNNLNQIAKAANIDPIDRVQVGQALEVLRAIFDLVLRALGRCP